MKKFTDSIRLRHGTQLANRIVQPPMMSFWGVKKGGPAKKPWRITKEGCN
ncbi:hypothetical protein [Facklamia sp. P9177]